MCLPHPWQIYSQFSVKKIGNYYNESLGALLPAKTNIYINIHYIRVGHREEKQINYERRRLRTAEENLKIIKICVWAVGHLDAGRGRGRARVPLHGTLRRVMNLKKKLVFTSAEQ